MTVPDPVLTGMAGELRRALKKVGADPANPPEGTMPAGKAWTEYLRRGGTELKSIEDFGPALLEAVKAG